MKLLFKTGLIPIIELERGEIAGAMPIRKSRPVIDYLKLQKRFKHLFTDDAKAREELEHLQALADHNIEKYGLCSDGEDPHDCEGADTVHRGGMHYA